MIKVVLKVFQLFGLMGGWLILTIAAYAIFWFISIPELQMMGLEELYNLGIIGDGYIIDMFVQFMKANYFLPVLLGGWLLLIIGNHMERSKTLESK